MCTFISNISYFCTSFYNLIFKNIITVDFSKLFDKEALIQKIKEQGKALTKLVVSELINEFLKLLNIPKVRNSVRILLLSYHFLKYLIHGCTCFLKYRLTCSQFFIQ